MTERHELCHPADLICTDAEVSKQMTSNLEEAGCPMDLEEAEKTAAEMCIRDRLWLEVQEV